MPVEPLLAVHAVVKDYALKGGPFGHRRQRLRAVDGVSFELRRGESFGLVGESGCGKTTLGQLVARLAEPSAGRIVFDGQDITHLSNSRMRPLRRRLQVIFQDPYASLDPRMRVGAIVTEALRTGRRLSRDDQRQAARTMLATVGLHPDDARKFAHQFSGGQRQRISIARALCVRPELIVADEPVSALDVSIQAQVINLLTDLKSDFGLSYLFISHDLSVVEHICNRIAVMYMGTLVEVAPTAAIIRTARHPYTRELLAAVPLPDPTRRRPPVELEGDVPNPLDPPPGCLFHPRCAHVHTPCRTERPALRPVATDHQVACWLNRGQGLLPGENR